MKLFFRLIVLGLICLQVYAQNNGTNGVQPTDLTKPIVISKSSPQFFVTLKSNPTTGYSWFLQSYDNNLVIPLGQEYVPPAAGVPGAGGYEVLSFKMSPRAFTAKHMTQIMLIYARPWELGTAQGNTKTITINVVTQSN